MYKYVHIHTYTYILLYTYILKYIYIYIYNIHIYIYIYIYIHVSIYTYWAAVKINGLRLVQKNVSYQFCGGALSLYSVLFKSHLPLPFVSSRSFRYLLSFASTLLSCSSCSSFPFNLSISLRPSFRCNSSLPFVTSFLSFQLFVIPFVTSSLSFQLFPSVPYGMPFASTLFFRPLLLAIVSTLPSCSFKPLPSGGIRLQGAIRLREFVFAIRLREGSRLRGAIRLRAIRLLNSCSGGNSSLGRNSSSGNLSSQFVFGKSSSGRNSSSGNLSSQFVFGKSSSGRNSSSGNSSSSADGKVIPAQRPQWLSSNSPM